jgi:glycosyltransferase involved in cell wall biosynthesis
MPTVIFSVGVWLPGGGMGNHAYYLVKGLERHGLLKQAYIMRKVANDLSPALFHDFYLIERLAYRFARYCSLDKYVVRDNLFDFWISRQLPQATIFYGWTHHALWSLKRAKRKGMLTVIERANSHPITYTRLLEQEYHKLGIPYTPYHPAILKKHLAEIRETDYIAVTSQFTKASLLEHGIREKQILLTPLGIDTTHYHPSLLETETKDSRQPFRVLYVGQICIRKGIHYLLEAWTKLRLANAELVLVGEVLAELYDTVRQHLKQDTTITLVPHAPDPVAFYQKASVCILPTLEDGFGLVVLEAMACGVPVIITEHTGAKDCVRSGKDGFLIPPYDADAIADTLKSCYTHRETLRQMGILARQQAERYSWQRYQDTVAEHIRRIVPSAYS